LRSMRHLPLGFVPPCLPIAAARPPSGPEWLREIKHDGFRCIARKSGQRVRLYSGAGNDLTDRFPLIVTALSSLRARSCIIDGEAVACDDDIASFERMRDWRHGDSVFLYAGGRGGALKSFTRNRRTRLRSNRWRCGSDRYRTSAKAQRGPRQRSSGRLASSL
jgi:hypothetical protein